MNPNATTKLSEADAAALERLLAGESLADVIAASEPDRAERVSRLLSLLDAWKADDPKPGLVASTMASVLANDPVTLSPADGEALDAVLDLRRQGLNDGPMPAGVRERVAGVSAVLSLLDRSDDEPVPADLRDRVMQAVDADRRAQAQRTALSSMAVSHDRHSTIGIRQVATTAALLLMCLSILLPMLSNAQKQAEIAQCGENLAGLGADLQQIAFDYKGQTHEPSRPDTSTFNPLARFARTAVDGSIIPPEEAGVFVILDEQRLASRHLSCPAGERNDPASLYNGQNPAAGGPFRIFLKPRPIFADANPLYRVTDRGLVRNGDVPSLARSVNHNSAGQNVLISDGSVRWMIRPAVQRDHETADNIWLYQGDATQDDIFLTP
jgi:hypothetical protein